MSQESELSKARAAWTSDFLRVFGLSFLFYDHLITLDSEIRYLWRRPKSIGSFWFFLNRYLAFFGNILVLVFGFKDLETTSCRQFGLYRQALLVASEVIVGAISTIRVYALYNRSRRILLLFIFAALIGIGVCLTALLIQDGPPESSKDLQISGCHHGLSRTAGIHLAMAWEALFAFDTLVVVATVMRTYRSRHWPQFGYGPNLVFLMLRDGALYFVAISLANLANILTFYFAGTFLRGSLSSFASSMAVTMMSRLMLNLHESADRGVFSTGFTEEETDSFTATMRLQSRPVFQTAGEVTPYPHAPPRPTFAELDVEEYDRGSRDDRGGRHGVRWDR